MVVCTDEGSRWLDDEVDSELCAVEVETTELDEVVCSSCRLLVNRELEV